MKKKSLTKKLIITAIIWLSINCVVAGAYFWFDSDIEQLQNETQQKKSGYQSNFVLLASTAKNIKSSEIAHERFNNFLKSDDNNKDLFRRNALIRKLGEITSELRAIKASFTMSPFEKYSVLPTKSDKIDLVYSRVSLKYEALSDVTAFKILKLISEKLNGTVYFKKFTIQKKGEIDSDVLLRISNGEIPTLVEGEIEFDWITIRLKDGALGTPTIPSAAPKTAGQNV